MGSPFLKGQFGPLTGRKVGPTLLLILVETAEEGHVAIEGTKLGQCDRAMRHIDDTGIELAHHIEHASPSLIKIPSARIPSIGKQINLNGTTFRPYEREMKIVPREERIGGSSRDRQAHLICRELDSGRHRPFVVTGNQEQEQAGQVPCWIWPTHLVAGTFGAAPIAPSPA